MSARRGRLCLSGDRGGVEERSLAATRGIWTWPRRLNVVMVASVMVRRRRRCRRPKAVRVPLDRLASFRRAG